MKETLHYFVSSIVDHTEDVQIDETEQEGTTVFTIHVNPEDMGRLIGKEGKIIRSLRNVMKIVAMKQNRRINIMLAEQKS